ncbi:MAG TPA: sugar MFS transporter, partial [Flavihumibacter sp.]|nr:sugar MFS transporter [Flavihumibacter sp.]
MENAIADRDRSVVKPLLVIAILFFVFGFVTWLGSVLIPYLRIACELSNLSSYLIAFSFYISYFVLALPAAALLKKTGFKNGISLGLLIMAFGALLFVPAALTRQFPLFLLGQFIQGAGISLLQSAANPYVTILGPPASAARRMSVMGICSGIAGILAPLVLGSVILENADEVKAAVEALQGHEKNIALDQLAHRVISPYIIMAVVLLLLAGFSHFSRLPEVNEDPGDEIGSAETGKKTSIWQFPHLWLGVLSIFVYVGTEVISVDSVVNYSHFQGYSLSAGKYFSSGTLFMMLVGYLVGLICIPRLISQQKALQVSALLGLSLVSSALFTSGTVSVLLITLLGLANSLMWPAIWPLAIADLGKFTKTGTSLLIMAIGGGALLPLLFGYLTDKLNNQQAYLLLLPCYFIIWFFAKWGYLIRV